jgi:hypothetical protein
MKLQLNRDNEFINPKKTSIWEKWHALEDTQANKKTMWFTLSLIVQGIFLPIPVYLIFYHHAPVFLGILSLMLYFSNMIAGMGGDRIRVTISIFALSFLTHLTMLLVYGF